MGSWDDFNDAQSNSNLIPKGTLAKVRLTIRPGGFDDASQGWTGGYATRGSTGAVYLNGEFTVTEGQYARRKVFTLIGLYSPKGPDWGNMGRALVRGMLVYSGGIAEGHPYLHLGAVSARAPEQDLYRERCLHLGRVLTRKAIALFGE